MNDYIELRVDMEPASETASDIMAALLAEKGFESFVPDQRGLTAYIRKESYCEADIKEVIADFPIDCMITCSTSEIEGRDWNSEWERHYFQPIVVGDRCVIHSSFHTDIPTATYDIVIDPKMAFGTGHHATTSLVIEQILDADLEGKTVIDMGTGTGILSILAAMCGASEATGIEIDPAAHINAVENIALNHVDDRVRIILGDASALSDIDPADMFIANINRNIITADIGAYASRLVSGGTMLLSGFYESDIPVVAEAASPYGLNEVSHTVRGDGWTCLRLIKG